MHDGVRLRPLVDDNRVQKPLSDFDAMLVRSMPLGSLEQVIFRVNALHAAQAAGCRVVNKPRTLEIAIDKWLTLATVANFGIATPRTFVCQSRDQAIQAFESLAGDVVVKPIFGGEGRGLMRISCPDLAWRVFGTLEVNQSVLYLQEFIPHSGSDIRIFLIGDDAFAMTRSNPNDWRTNISRGAIGTAYQATAEELDIAVKAASAIDADIIGVDLLRANDGRLLLIEVNAIPGWKGLANALNLDISRRVIDYLKRPELVRIKN
jgi:ribosomal protein S6--L-glutamate ligase